MGEDLAKCRDALRPGLALFHDREGLLVFPDQKPFTIMGGGRVDTDGGAAKNSF